VQLSRTMQAAWVHFAATGDVNAPGNGLPYWAPFGFSGEIMALDAQPKSVSHPIPYFAEKTTINGRDWQWL
jgi:hypothetical protein